MFTGIINNFGNISQLYKKDSGYAIDLLSPEIFSKVKLGDSVSINGVCLTVTEKKNDGLLGFDVWKESLIRTKPLELNQRVHIDLPLLETDFIGGHCVLGHIDYVSECLSRCFVSDSKQLKLKFSYPKRYSSLLPLRGSVAINGVSLTVTEKTREYFSVSLIPETLKNTLLGDIDASDTVNVELDYYSRIIQDSEGILSYYLDLTLQEEDSEKTLISGGVVAIENKKGFFLASLTNMSNETRAFLIQISHSISEIMNFDNHQLELFFLYDCQMQAYSRIQFESLCARFLIPILGNRVL